MEKSESFIPAKSEHFGMRLPDMMGEADEKVSGDMGMDDRVRVMNGFDTQETFLVALRNSQQNQEESVG
ncbi:hypothetical protein A3K29_00275 [Candidatus Collierbacteria bacterium RIFOXYB2_FULL_46_14]|nr:MAG: hypothetical protein A3K29_00275 [Candidatus Collierbacteria bacterium RIFOXYB2_FULL_46_14]OGD75616.1 MAG: hypothetical protein A3K43_00275 [Candidatus Collierbacteria bacterium RIFOXYA2_FULL_46_20]OGD76952.1 MAG: hypothetical protein A3K39_00275 [Candidatus Collierbacteria bacterium RIFOXYC2_FULL_43_15]OGD80243.1 MAG: hypothetical protein A2320_00765 [Pseudomonadales bacterium GWC2_63_15]OGD81674.1 MAG: hypothetical protein A3K36_00275 [Candidatus Collierbacteria bacterium RIFOXYD2_FUL